MFVVCWVYSRKALEDENPWIMVLNKNRGWELPGGEISENEDFDIAALRELYEETGLLGTAIRYDEDIIEGGVVVLIEVENSPNPEPWDSLDPSIIEVGWCLEPPTRLAWEEEELEKIRNHDWSSSKTLES
ncbi:MAG: NUDIX domain-containing protein [Candidatus Thermoplasmatota archaeon]|nr:NUDIX domain-containing protein [Candidatus Thermoplasmatota archaeon]